MTEKEIAKVLRCCQFGEPCDRCPVVRDQNCVDVMHKCAADLIERLTAENAALRKEIEWKDMVIALAQRKQVEAEAERDALIEMGRKFRAAGFRPSSHTMCCYVLCGYDGDSFEDAEKRLVQTMQAGFVPYAMLFRGEDGQYAPEWRRFQREWCRPIITGKKFNEYWREKRDE